MPAQIAPKAVPTTALDGWTLPDYWTDSARDLFAEVLAERPDLAGADLGALEGACALVSAADRLGEVARAEGMIATGSAGQTVAHPAAVEERLSRSAAASILARLSPARAERFTARARTAARVRHSGGAK